MLVTIHTGNQVLRVAKTDGDDDDPSLRPRSFEIRPGRGTQLMMAGYRPRCNTGMITNPTLPKVPLFCKARELAADLLYRHWKNRSASKKVKSCEHTWGEKQS